ncbi:hypothetical protein IWX90DRAFT_483838 [Phyllosticta citrichinensis]|uniref:Uncharacterized protein n=1 Tax=Phyllosticta citrichinensis TaxID=1130410 RepID=A0ABR1Y453_9PEZI
MPVTRKTTSKPGLMARLRGHKNITTTTTTTTTRKTRSHRNPTRRTGHTTTAAPVHHHKRRPSLKDKVSGAMLKLKGAVTRRPGEKAAGTRRMRGTDGRGSHHRY